MRRAERHDAAEVGRRRCRCRPRDEPAHAVRDDMHRPARAVDLACQCRAERADVLPPVERPVRGVEAGRPQRELQPGVEQRDHAERRDALLAGAVERQPAEPPDRHVERIEPHHVVDDPAPPAERRAHDARQDQHLGRSACRPRRAPRQPTQVRQRVGAEIGGQQVVVRAALDRLLDVRRPHPERIGRRADAALARICHHLLLPDLCCRAGCGPPGARGLVAARNRINVYVGRSVGSATPCRSAWQPDAAAGAHHRFAADPAFCCRRPATPPRIPPIVQAAACRHERCLM